MRNSISKLLHDIQAFDSQELVAQKSEIDQIINTNNGKYKIFHIICQRNHYDRLEISNVGVGLDTLKFKLEKFDVKKLRMSRSGNKTDSLAKGKL